MECYNCGCPLSELDYCTNCGADVKRYKKIIYTSNRLYNEGLERAGVRDMSGAIRALRECLKCNKSHVDARNLLGLIYYETGEAVAAFVEWVVSMNIRPEKNVADEYINMVQADRGRLDTINATLKKYNLALNYCHQGSNDLAVIQLKKVLSLNPKFAKAHRLLALLYMERADWDRARKELDRCLRIDVGDVDAMRYLQEIRIQTQPADEKQGRKKRKREETAQVYRGSGNDMIIQPVPTKEPLGLHVFLQIGFGLLLGALVTYFLLMPAREAAVRGEESEKQKSVSEEIDVKNVEITDLNARIKELEENLQQKDEQLGEYGSEGTTAQANDHLEAAAYAYLDPGQDVLTVEQFLGMIPKEYVDEKASTEFLDLYKFLNGAIGDSVASDYYDSGLEAYRQQDMKLAAEHLAKAWQYDSSNSDALYFLGMAYFYQGDNAAATECFEKLISTFPDSPQVDKAKLHLEEMQNQ